MREKKNNNKNSGIEWIGKIPFPWELKRVKNLFYISKQKANIQNPVVLSLARSGVKVRDISNNEGQLAESYEEYNPVIPGDLLLNPMDLYSGANCGMSEVSGVISPAYINLRANDNNVNPKFYDYYFKVQYWSMAMFAHGKGVSYDNRWTINRETILNYYLPYISFDKQNDIVKLLNDKLLKISKMIEIEELQIEKLKEYKQSLIIEVVTKGLDKNAEMKDSGVEWIGKIPKDWQLLPIKAKFKSGKGLPITKADLIEEGTKVISYGQIHAKDNISVEINNSLYRYVDNQWLQSNIDCIVKKGDFIFADTSEDVTGSGDFIYVNNDDLVFAGYHCLTLKPIDGNCNNKYLAYLFLSSVWKSQLQSKVCGVKLYSISKKFLMSTSIILPPINEQKEITNFLDGKCKTIEEVIVIKKEKIEKLNEYKKSLIYEYVTGKKEI